MTRVDTRSSTQPSPQAGPQPWRKETGDVASNSSKRYVSVRVKGHRRRGRLNVYKVKNLQKCRVESRFWVMMLAPEYKGRTIHYAYTPKTKVMVTSNKWNDQAALKYAAKGIHGKVQKFTL